MNRFFKACAAGLTVALMGLASLPAQAAVAVTTTLLFNSLCEDCVTSEGDASKNHPVSATLVLNGDYGVGTHYFEIADLISFSYSGTNKLTPYVITADNVAYMDGTYVGTMGEYGLDISMNVYLRSYDYVFAAYQRLEGNPYWDTGTVDHPADQGSLVNWQKVGLTNDIPEPATMLLVGAALAGLGLSRRRRQA